jgi:DNA-binding beta-propeller fold protein YncE
MKSNRLALRALVLLSLFAIGCAQEQKKPQAKAAFWPPYPDEPRVQYLTSFKSSTDVAPSKNKLDELVYGKEPQQNLNLAKPYGVDMYDGKIYVCDLRNDCITVLDLRKKQTLILGRTGADTLQTPSDITIAPDGMKYVADLGRGRIYVFDQNERQLGSFGHEGLKPVGVAVYQNELYVCDFAKQRVEVLDRGSGSLIRTFGEPGQGPGQFIRPLGIAVDEQGNVYVTDVLNCRMQKFDRAGKVVTAFGITSANAGGFVRPKHIAVDKAGLIYVVDAAFQNVQIFDQVGRPLTFFGTAGEHPGNMYLPAGICVSDIGLDMFQAYVHPAFEAERLILVTNQFGDNKVAIYALGHLKPGMTVKDISASEGIVPKGTGEQNKTGPGAPLPTTAPDDILSAAPSTQPAIAPVSAPPPVTGGR